MKLDKINVKIINGDITKCEVDAIVNAAKSSLMGGGGVDGAIHRAGGPSILLECKKIVAEIGECPPGEAVITGAGNLKANFIIHTVGPIWYGGNKNESALLRNAYINSLKLAEKNEVKSVAFPNISTGVYRFPKELAVKEAKAAIEEFSSVSRNIQNIYFVCFDEENFQLYKKEFSQ